MENKQNTHLQLILKRLENEMIFKGMTKRQLAQRCSLSYPSTMNIFSGRINPSFNQVQTIAKELDFDLNIIEKEITYIQVLRSGNLVEIVKIENKVLTKIKSIEMNGEMNDEFYKNVTEIIIPFFICGVELRVKL